MLEAWATPQTLSPYHFPAGIARLCQANPYLSSIELDDTTPKNYSLSLWGRGKARETPFSAPSLPASYSPDRQAHRQILLFIAKGRGTHGVPYREERGIIVIPHVLALPNETCNDLAFVTIVCYTSYMKKVKLKKCPSCGREHTGLTETCGDCQREALTNVTTIVTAPKIEALASGRGFGTGKGRPRIHKSNADRQKAWREKDGTIT